MRAHVRADTPVVGPGQLVTLEVAVTNDADDGLLPVLSVRGVAPEHVERVDRGVELAPGATGTAVVQVRIPLDAVPGDVRVAVQVADADGLHTPTLVTVDLEVGERPPVGVELDPPSVRGRTGGRTRTVLHNHGTTALALTLSAETEDDLDVEFSPPALTLAPGASARVRTRVRRDRRSWFRELRHGLLVDVSAGGRRLTVPTSFVQRPTIPPLLLSMTALLLVVALWGTALVAVNARFIEPRDDVAAAGDGAPTVTPAVGDQATEGATEGDTADGDGEGGDGGGPPVIVEGEVTGPADPAGSRVTIERVSFGDRGTTDESGTTKVAALTSVSLPVAQVIDRADTSTDARGRFRFASGLAPSAYYRVTATRPGFEVASAIVETEADPTDHEVTLDLVPASGGMSGRVTSTEGTPLGGAEIVITGGELTYRTTTDTEGDIGRWSVDGMAALPAYAISAREPKHASASVVRSLDAGQRLTGVDLQLAPNLGTVRGRTSHRGEGVGAIDVTLSGNGVERTTTSLTDEGLEGRFELPALPFGDYTLTLAGAGWMTATTEIVVDRGDVELVLDDLVPATARVQGTVVQEVVTGTCTYPSAEERDNVSLAPCGGVSVSLEGPEGTFRTTTDTTRGQFDLTSVRPGTYTVRFERTGYISQFMTVELAAGDVHTVSGDATSTSDDTAPAARVALEDAVPVAMRLVPVASAAVGELRGVLRDGDAPNDAFEPPAGTQISVDDQPDAVVTQLEGGSFTITALEPGAQTLRVAAPGFDDFSTVVRVRANEPSDAGALVLTPLATLAMIVTDGNATPIGGADVFVTPALDGGDARLDAFTDDGVVACTVGTDAAGRWRLGITDGTTLDGLCTTVTDAGDAAMRRALGTGSYRVIGPVNADDAADDAEDQAARERRAGTVPLDHEQMDRLVEVTSGETNRLELRARRYPVIQGRIRVPGAAGFRDATHDDFRSGDVDGLSTFPEPSTYDDGEDPEALLGLELQGFVDGSAVEAPPGLGPRLSFGPADGLPEGVYRINRVLPSEGEALREYDLGFYGIESRTFRYTGSEQLTNLTYGEVRSTNAVLIPPPVPVNVRLRWQQGEDLEPVRDADPVVTVTGIVGYRFEGGGQIPIEETVVWNAGPAGEGTVTEEVDGEQVPALFLAGEDLNIDVQATGYERSTADYELESGTPIQIVLEPIRRDVVGTLRIVPASASTPVALAQVVVDMTPTSDGEDPGDPTVTIDGDTLTFRFDDVRPNEFEVTATGPDLFPYASGPLAVPPGPSDVTVQLGPEGATRDGSPAPPFLVDREVDLTVRITEEFASEEDVVRGATVTLLLPDGDDGTDDVVASGSTGDDGEVTFADLRGGPDRTYTFTVEKLGYHAVDGPAPTTTLDEIANDVAGELVRFGTVEAFVESIVNEERTDHPPLDGAKGRLLTSSGDPVIGADGTAVEATSTSPDGRLTIPHTEEVPAGQYVLDVTHPDHEPEDESVTFTDATVSPAVTVALLKKRASVSGIVTDEDGDPLANVRVQALDPTGASFDPPQEVVTGPDGAYALTGLPPERVLLRFEEFADPGSQNATSRRKHEHEEELGADARVTYDAQLVEQLDAISGTVEGEDFAGAQEAPLTGVTVTATCLSGPCGEGNTLTTTTDADGRYAFHVVTVGRYRVRFTLDGYRPGGGDVLEVRRFTEDDTVGGVADGLLTAIPVTVTATVTGDVTRDVPLDGIRVTATRAGSPQPDPGSDGDIVLEGTTTSGSVTLGLPPGDWTIATVGADAADVQPRPHVDTSDGIVVAADDDPHTVGLLPEPYVRVSGTVRGRAHANATDALLVGATVVPVQIGSAGPAYPASVGDATPTPGGGTFAAFLPPTTGADRTWRLEVRHGDHAGGDLLVTLGQGAGDVALAPATPTGVSLESPNADLPAAFAGADGGVALTATPRAVRVTTTSSADQSELTGIDVTATWVPGGTAPPTSGAYTTTDTTAAGAAATLVLPPGSWTLTTAGAATGDGLPDQPPHKEEPGRTVGVPTGADPPTTDLQLQRYASARGSVRVPVPDDQPVERDDIAVSVPSPGFEDVIPEPLSNVDLPDANWRVWLPDPADVTVLFDLGGYRTGQADVVTGDFTGRDALAATVVLEGAPRTVQLLVVSAATEQPQNGVAVTATDVDGVLAPVTVTTATVTRDGQPVDGIADFTGSDGLAPATWRFTTSGATGLTQPHNDVDVGDGETRFVGPSTQPLVLDNQNGAQRRLELVRYSMVTGKVATRDFPGDFQERGGITVLAPSAPTGTRVESPSRADGGWTIWLPEPTSVVVQFRLDGYSDEDLTVAAASPGRDRSVDTVPVLEAYPRTVNLLVTSTDGTTPLPGLTVTATRSGTSDTRDVTTGADGVARFAQVAGGDDDRLAPTTWEFTTDGGELLSPPHNDLTSGTDTRVIPVGTDAQDPLPLTGAGERLELAPYAVVTGTVSTETYDGDPSPQATDAPSIAVASPAIAEGVGVDSTPGRWRVYLPSPDDLTVAFTLAGYQDGSAVLDAGDFTSGAADGGAVMLTALTREVALSVVSDRSETALPGVMVSATSVAVANPVEVATDGSGVATFTSLAPVSWTFTTTNATTLRPTAADYALADDGDLPISSRPHADATVDRDVPVATSATPPTVPLTGATALTLVAYAQFSGIVTDSAASLPQAGVAVGSTAPADAITGPDTNVEGEWYGWVPNPTTGTGTDPRARFTFSKAPFTDGELTATTDVVADRPGSDVALDLPLSFGVSTPGTPPPAAPPKAADRPDATTAAVEPAAPPGAVLRGVVTHPGGAPVAGAEVTAAHAGGTTRVLTDAGGNYVLAGLPPYATTAVTFTPPPGAPGVPVTRWVAPGGAGDITIALDQEVPASLGNIAVAVSGGTPGNAVRVMLTETTPFPTLPGPVVRESTLDAAGAAVITVTDLVPGDDTSVPEGRFTVEVTSPGTEGTVVDAVEVVAGATTPVPVTLTLLAPPERRVVLELVDAGGPVLGQSAVLVREGVRLLGTNAPGSNVHEFAAVTAGEWQVEVAGREPASVVVPAGTGVLSVGRVEVVPLPRAVSMDVRDPTGAVVDVAAAVLVRGDAVLLPTATAGGILAFDAVPVGTWMLTGVDGWTDAEVVVTPGVGRETIVVVVDALPRDVDLTITDEDGEPVVGASPVLVRDDRRLVGTELAPGTYAVEDVAVGTWTLSGLDGAADVVVDVPPGPGTVVVTVVVSRAPTPEPSTEEPLVTVP